MNIKALREETRKLTLLYAEDEDEIRDSTKEFFSKYFKSVDSVENGKVGLELFKKNGYDVVISDLKMPVMGGEEMMESISKIDPKAVTVSMSGISGSNNWDIIVYDFSVSKPASLTELSDMMIKVVEEAKRRRN